MKLAITCINSKENIEDDLKTRLNTCNIPLFNHNRYLFIIILPKTNTFVINKYIKFILLNCFLQGSENSLNMIEKWTLCIEVYCYPNLGKSNITYVLCNIATNKVLQRKMNVPGRKTNNEAYYIALIEGLGIAREYGSNGIVVFTNS